MCQIILRTTESPGSRLNVDEKPLDISLLGDGSGHLRWHLDPDRDLMFILTMDPRMLLHVDLSCVIILPKAWKLLRTRAVYTFVGVAHQFSPHFWIVTPFKG